MINKRGENPQSLLKLHNVIIITSMYFTTQIAKLSLHVAKTLLLFVLTHYIEQHQCWDVPSQQC